MTPDSEQRLRAGSARLAARLPNRSLLVFGIWSAVVVGGAVALAGASAGRHVDLAALILTGGLLVAADRMSIPVGSVWTSPTQVAFVPMLLLLPPGWVPLLVVVARFVTSLTNGKQRSVSVITTYVGDAAYAFGPALVLVAAGQMRFGWSHWPIYLAAIVAQFVVDVPTGYARVWLAERILMAKPPELVWPLLTDFCLSCTGLLVAGAAATGGSALVLMALPVLLLLSMFARERKQRLEQSLELSTAYRGTAELLGDVIEDDDAYTGMHTKQVVDLSVAVADHMGVDGPTRRMVEYGALLHDVGKLRVPNVIIRKEGKLDDAEWEVMREHTVAGEEMLALVGGQLADVGRIVRASHEKYDGSGYPDGLVGEDIPMAARIISASDAWNAMTTTRSYRRALSFEVASAEMQRCAGTHFDPTVVKALLAVVADENYVAPVQTEAPIPLDLPLPVPSA